MKKSGLLGLVGLLVLCVGASPAPPPSPAEASDAANSIAALHAELLDVMQNAESLGYAGRTEKLTPVIPRHFDVEFMARKAVGRHWKNASDDEKRLYLDAFGRFMVANWAGRLDGYAGQHFETLGEEPAKFETLLVKTQIVDPNDDNVELSYRLRETPDGWKIIDVYMDGTVSELSLRRSEFSSVAKREGFNALIQTLEAKIDKLAAKG